jgi:hypothetical protein
MRGRKGRLAVLKGAERAQLCQERYARARALRGGPRGRGMNGSRLLLKGLEAQAGGAGGRQQGGGGPLEAGWAHVDAEPLEARGRRHPGHTSRARRAMTFILRAGGGKEGARHAFARPTARSHPACAGADAACARTLRRPQQGAPGRRRQPQGGAWGGVKRSKRGGQSGSQQAEGTSRRRGPNYNARPAAPVPEGASSGAGGAQRGRTEASRAGYARAPGARCCALTGVVGLAGRRPAASLGPRAPVRCTGVLDSASDARLAPNSPNYHNIPGPGQAAPLPGTPTKGWRSGVGAHWRAPLGRHVVRARHTSAPPPGLRSVCSNCTAWPLAEARSVRGWPCTSMVSPAWHSALKSIST